jgi:hypothetical protein
VSNIPPPPTEDEAMDIAGRFLSAAISHAEDGPSKGIDMVTQFFDCDPVEAAFRVWYWASVGSIIAAAGVKALNPVAPSEGEFWGLVPLPGVDTDESDPSATAAAQCIVAHLNEDAEGAHDITTAHFKVAGHEGLFLMVCQFILVCSALAKEGAFG